MYLTNQTSKLKQLWMWGLELDPKTMRACPVSLEPSYPLLLHFHFQAAATPTTPSPTRFLIPVSQSLLTSSTRSLHSQYRPNPRCSNIDSTALDDDNDGYVLLEEGDQSDSLSRDGVCIEIKKLATNSRRIRSKITIDATLDTVWNILTDYENLADFIPGLAVNKLVEKKDNFARLYQIGQQNLPFGLKFNAKGVLDCYEKDLESFPSGKRRDIEFKMIDGDFQVFEGKWSIEQFNKGKCEENDSLHGQEFQTTLSYLVDVKPKLWLPVHLVEGRLCNEIKTNLLCIREEAQKLIRNIQRAQ